jgi:N,N'-diacetyllegionaminate synthase
LIIAEVGQAHDGSLGNAHAFIDAIAQTGADAVKFQTHIADKESSTFEPWRTKFSYQDATRYDYWKRLEFSSEQWVELKCHAEEKGLIFLSSPFSMAAFQLLQSMGIKAWKVASGELTNPALVNAMISTGKPLIISSGMAKIEEVDKVVRKCEQSSVQFAVLQCTSTYPTPPEKCGLNMIDFFRERYKCPVGLSDHSGKIFPAIAASALGAEILEVHICFSREGFGPDSTSSVTIPELCQIVEGAQFVSKSLNTRFNKNDFANEMKNMRSMFGHGLVADYDLSSGVILSENNLSFRKPCRGIPVSQFYDTIGKRLKRNLKANEFIFPDDLEDAS